MVILKPYFLICCKQKAPIMYEWFDEEILNIGYTLLAYGDMLGRVFTALCSGGSVDRYTLTGLLLITLFAFLNKSNGALRGVAMSFAVASLMAEVSESAEDPQSPYFKPTIFIQLTLGLFKGTTAHGLVVYFSSLALSYLLMVPSLTPLAFVFYVSSLISICAMARARSCSLYNQVIPVLGARVLANAVPVLTSPNPLAQVLHTLILVTILILHKSPNLSLSGIPLLYLMGNYLSVSKAAPLDSLLYLCISILVGLVLLFGLSLRRSKDCVIWGLGVGVAASAPVMSISNLVSNPFSAVIPVNLSISKLCLGLAICIVWTLLGLNLIRRRQSQFDGIVIGWCGLMAVGWSVCLLNGGNPDLFFAFTLLSILSVINDQGCIGNLMAFGVTAVQLGRVKTVTLPYAVAFILPFLVPKTSLSEWDQAAYSALIGYVAGGLAISASIYESLPNADLMNSLSVPWTFFTIPVALFLLSKRCRVGVSGLALAILGRGCAGSVALAALNNNGIVSSIANSTAMLLPAGLSILLFLLKDANLALLVFLLPMSYNLAPSLAGSAIGKFGNLVYFLYVSPTVSPYTLHVSVLLLVMIVVACLLPKRCCSVLVLLAACILSTSMNALTEYAPECDFNLLILLKSTALAIFYSLFSLKLLKTRKHCLYERCDGLVY